MDDNNRLCPTTNFLGEPIYADNRENVNPKEIERRLTNYYWPYHREITRLLESLKSEFGKVLIWDAHSIRRQVRTIHQGSFPDLILGDVMGTSASANITKAALDDLRSSTYSVSHNDPFKGGFITRCYGNPKNNQHALQLEMSKINYMDDSETRYDQDRANKIKTLLRKVFGTLAEVMNQ
jgi:N-formylglutamate deformylase